MKYEQEYTEWLYERFPIYNGDALISYLEDEVIYARFLEENGLYDNS